MELSGRRYGHIRVNEPIGEGGMGSVYAGFDETLHRRVAVKVLQDEQRLDPESRSRLIREARSLSRLDHPNICRIHDYIQDDDVDLLVLEFIEGKTLREAIEGGLSRAERMRIAIAVAEVLVVAHRAGIIHRDLKPENVMLTQSGQVKVLDFGLARWTDERGKSVRLAAAEVAPRAVTDGEARLWVLDERSRTPTTPLELRTAVGLTVGTPLYMSPEQARGESLTAASDMHSFGLLLQALFTGKDPYPEHLSARAVLLLASRNDSLPPTGVDKPVVSLITQLKQLAPTDRPTAAETLRRLKQIETRPRRLAQQAAAAFVLLLMLLGTAKYTVDLRRERAAALAAEQRAVAALQEAAQRRGQAEELFGFMLGDLRKKLEPLGRLEILDAAGERALTYAGSLRPELMTAEELARNAKALTQLGEVRVAQGRLAEAAPVFVKARDLAAAGVKKDPGNTNAQLALMTGHFWVGQSAHLRGELDAALREMELYLATANRLANVDPTNADYRMEQAYAHANVATLLMSKGRQAEARPHLEQTLRIKRARAAEEPSNLEWQADLANTINKLGVNLAKTGDYAGARAQFEEQKRICERLVASAPDHAVWKERLAIAHAYVASTYAATGELAGAEREYTSELAIERSLTAHDPANAEWRRNLAITTARLAVLQSRRGAVAESVAGFRQAESLLDDVARRDPDRASYKADLALTRSRNAMAALARGDLARARAAWNAAAPLLPRIESDAATKQHALEVLLAGIAAARAGGDAAQAEALRQRAETITGAPPFTTSTEPDLMALRARLLVSVGRRDAAAPLIARLSAIGYHQPDYESTVHPQP